MTLEEFRKLDSSILVRSIAEVVCGWSRGRIGVSEYDCSDYMWQRFAEEPLLCSKFNPLTSIDDAVLCVSKLDESLRLEHTRQLLQLVNPRVSFTIMREECAINANALLRIYALCLTMPSILERYKELKGNG